MVNHFLSKNSKFFIVSTLWFCSNYACVPNTSLSNNIWRDFTLSCTTLHFFCRKFVVKTSLLPVLMLTLEVYNIKSLNKKNFVPHTSKIWTKSFDRNYTKFWTFDKRWFLTPFLTKRWCHFESCFCSWNNCLMLRYYFQTNIFQCSKN